MRQLALALSLLVIIIALGCGRQAAPPPAAPAAPAKLADLGALVVAPQEPGQDSKRPGEVDPEKPVIPTEAADDDNYETALSDALGALADQKWQQALEAFEAARRLNDTEFVRTEIAKLKVRIDQDNAADKTVRDIEAILSEGRAQDASKLAQDALKEFGGSDVSNQLVKLRLQADAIQLVGAKEDGEARYRRYRDEAELALKEQNLRAAALAFEQAIQARDDERLRGQLDEVRGRLSKYDERRRRAAEMRRDPQQLDEALELLNDAAQAWDTLQVRQEIDEYTLALQKRRDNVSVAAFEVQGEIGFADAGRVVAEELLPHFKSRFDLVERGQINKVIQELKLEETFLDDPGQQQELARLAKVRYLVVGSVRRLGGITVSARLVDARSGLIVQTGKIVAPNVDDAVARLPELAKQLLMSDDEKQAYDQQQARQVVRVAPPAPDAPLPPPPQPWVKATPPPVEIMELPPPLEFTGVPVEQFGRFAAPPVVGVKLIPPPPPEPVLQHRMLHAALHLGDNAFRLGLHKEAHRHFDFALNLAPGNFDIRLRLERCAPHLPPPAPLPVVIIDPVPAPVFVVKPRIVVLDFATYGHPGVVPPYLGRWTAQRLTPYLRSRYDIVDPAEVYWFMGRLGMSMRDIMDDPHARRWLARSVGARYIVLGTLVQTASFDVTTYVLDAEFGHLHSSAKMHVHNRGELQLRLGELAWLTTLDPAERNRYLGDNERFNALMVRGRQHNERREFDLAINIFNDALRIRPGHVEVMVHLGHSRRHADLFRLEEARRQAYLRQQALAQEAARRQFELARAAELARARALQGAALFDRGAYEQQRLVAHQQMVTRARFAIQGKNFSLGLDLFKGAADLVPVQTTVAGFTPHDELVREMAVARHEHDKSAQLRAAQERAAREAALRVQREKELALAQQKLIAERQREQALEVARRKAQEERDRLLYQSAFDDGQRFMAAGNYEAAVASLQSARRVKSTPAVEQMIALALQQQALGKTKDEGERKQLEAKLAAERQRRIEAEKEAKRNQQLYQQALELAQKALEQKQYDVAQTKYKEAGTLFQTDAVLTGLRKVESSRGEERRKADAVQDKTKKIQELLADGKSALATKQYAQAVGSYRAAKKLAPDNLDVLAGLTQAEEAQAKLGAAAKRKAEDAERQQNFARLLKSGQDNLKAKQFDAATVALQEALKLNPTDAEAKTALQTAENSRKQAVSDIKAAAAAKDRTEAYQKLLTDGRLALQGKRYDEAIKSFGAAQKLLPGDKTSAQFLADAQEAKADTEAALAAASKKRAGELQRAAELQKALSASRTAMVAKDFGAAAKALQQAAQLDPKSVAVQKAVADLQQARDAEKAADLKRQTATKLKDYIGAAQAALKKKDLAGAGQALAQARKLDPDDLTIAQLQRDIDQARKGAAVGDAFDDAVADGRKAYAAKQYAEAVRSFQQAAKLKPGDPLAAKLLQTAQQALKGVASADDAFDDAVADGRKAYAAKQYAEAVRSFQQAAKLKPGDALAAKLLQTAQQALKGVATVEDAFDDAVADGRKAYAAKQYAEAVRSFQQAAKLKPGDALAAKLLQTAQLALKDATPPGKEPPVKQPPVKQPPVKEPPTKEPLTKEPPVDPNKQFQQLLQAGNKALKEKEYADAVKAFRGAAKLRPNDAQVDGLLKQAQKLADEKMPPPKKKAELAPSGAPFVDAPAWLAASLSAGLRSIGSLSPGTPGERAGVRGLSIPRETAGWSRVRPLTPNPSPPEYRGRGEPHA